MNKKRILFMVGSGVFLLPPLAGAEGSATMGCVATPIAIGMALLPPEALTDLVRSKVGQGGGN